MASITLASITKANVGRNEVKVSGTIDLTDVKGVTELQLSLASPAAKLTNISLINTTSFSATVIGLTGGQKYEIKLTLTYSYEYIKSCSFQYKLNAESPIQTFTDTDPDYVQEMRDLVIQLGGQASPITTIKGEKENSINSTNSKIIYTKPEEFKFATDMGTDTKWEVSKGIQTILPNIYTFNTVATQWLNWHKQSENTACTVFQKGTTLSAAMLNNAYKYLQKITDYKPGDKVAQSMFTGLENILNGE